MKYHWDTLEVQQDLMKLDKVEGITSILPGGDYDTEGCRIIVEDSEDDLWVKGFVVDNYLGPKMSDVDVDMIELTDGLQDDTGLRSNNPNTALVYIAVRQYFVDKGAEVVESMDPYF